MGESTEGAWICPWGICTHDQAQACRADLKPSRGCGGRFPSNATPESARMEATRPYLRAPDAATPMVPSPHEVFTPRFFASSSQSLEWAVFMERIKATNSLAEMIAVMQEKLDELKAQLPKKVPHG